MVARLQRWLVWGSLAATAAWVAFWWPRSLLAAAAGVAVLCGAHALVLGVEFIVSRQVGARDVVPRASFWNFVRAWAAESRFALQVFAWRQPFRSDAIADHLPPRSGRGVVLVHGFLCNRGFWNPWMRALRASDRAFVAVNLEPIRGPIDRYVQGIEAAVQRVTAATGRAPLLVCHSMGGLAARAWLRQADASRVHGIVTIGTPHHGTWLARFGRTANARQMRVGADWLEEMSGDRSGARSARFTCWYSNCDNVVFPPSTAMLPGADNRLVAGRGHVEMAFDPKVRRETLALLDAP